MPVGELLGRIESRELTEWQAYEREFGPLGPERGDYQAALVAQVVAAVNSAKGARPKLTDFLLSWAPRRRQSAQEQLMVFRALASKAAASRTKD